MQNNGRPFVISLIAIFCLIGGILSLFSIFDEFSASTVGGIMNSLRILVLVAIFYGFWYLKKWGYKVSLIGFSTLFVLILFEQVFNSTLDLSGIIPSFLLFGLLVYYITKVEDIFVN